WKAKLECGPTIGAGNALLLAIDGAIREVGRRPQEDRDVVPPVGPGAAWTVDEARSRAVAQIVADRDLVPRASGCCRRAPVRIRPSVVWLFTLSRDDLERRGREIAVFELSLFAFGDRDLCRSRGTP